MFGNMKEAVYNTAMYFDNTYLDSWLQDELSKKMIKSVDKAVVLSNNAVDSKALGIIPVKQLSGGVKTLLLIRHDPSRVFNASTCGDNCARWILKMSKDRDITINLRHMMNFGDASFEIKILNNGQIVHNMKEYVLCAGLFLRDGE